MPVLTASPRPSDTTTDAPLLRDAAMPAVRFLTGPGAIDVLRVPVEAAGGQLLSATPRNVQYRPGSDLVVKYSAEITWPGRPLKRETIMAAAKIAGVHEGAVPVTALVDGRRVEVGVWRWPFDPVLLGLGTAVTPSSAAELCGIADPTTLSIKVLAFRPTERAGDDECPGAATHDGADTEHRSADASDHDCTDDLGAAGDNDSGHHLDAAGDNDARNHQPASLRAANHSEQLRLDQCLLHRELDHADGDAARSRVHAGHQELGSRRSRSRILGW